MANESPVQPQKSKGKRGHPERKQIFRVSCCIRIKQLSQRIRQDRREQVARLNSDIAILYCLMIVVNHPHHNLWVLNTVKNTNMPSLQDLPLSIIHNLVQHIIASAADARRKDALSPSSTSRKLRKAIFESTLLADVVMDYTKEKVDETRRIIKLSMRKKVK